MIKSITTHGIFCVYDEFRVKKEAKEIAYIMTCYFQLGEEEEAPRGPDPKLIWDGQQSTIDQTTKLAQQSVTLGIFM